MRNRGGFSGNGGGGRKGGQWLFKGPRVSFSQMNEFQRLVDSSVNVRNVTEPCT